MDAVERDTTSDVTSSDVTSCDVTTSDVTTCDVTTSDVGADADRLIQIRMQALETAEAEIARDRAELVLLRRLREENRQLIRRVAALSSALSARVVVAEAEASQAPISAPIIKEQRATSPTTPGAAPGASGLALGHLEDVIFATFVKG